MLSCFGWQLRVMTSVWCLAEAHGRGPCMYMHAKHGVPRTLPKAWSGSSHVAPASQAQRLNIRVP